MFPTAEVMNPLDLHCTSFVSPDFDEEYKEQFFEELNDELECSFVYWHDSKCAVSVTLTDKQEKFFRVSHSHAHISLCKSPTDQWRDLGLFVLDCDKLTDWTETTDDEVSFSPSTGCYRKLLSFQVSCTRSVYQLSNPVSATHTYLQSTADILPTDISPLLS